MNSPTPNLGILLRLLHQQWTQAIDTALDEAGFIDIRPSHSNVLAFTPSSGIQVSELSKLSKTRKQSITQAVEELEKLGYVERRPDPRDKRGRLVFLTVRGQAVQPTAMAAGKRIQQNWESVAGKENIDVLTSTLQLVLEKLPRGE